MLSPASPTRGKQRLGGWVPVFQAQVRSKHRKPVQESVTRPKLRRRVAKRQDATYTRGPRRRWGAEIAPSLGKGMGGTPISRGKPNGGEKGKKKEKCDRRPEPDLNQKSAKKTGRDLRQTSSMILHRFSHILPGYSTHGTMHEKPLGVYLARCGCSKAQDHFQNPSSTFDH